MKVWANLLVLAAGICLLSSTAFGGELDPGTGPNSTTGYTLNDIWNRLNSGTDGTPFTSFTEPSTDPVGTSGIVMTLYDIMMAAPKKDDVNGANSGDVLSGKTYWGLTGANWGTKTGTLPNVGQQNITCGPSDQVITRGYHDGTGTVAGDGDLVSGNILQGVDIFNVTGSVIGAAGNAVTGDVLSWKTFSNSAGANIAGTMPDNGAVNISPVAASQSIPAGYHDGTGTVAGDAALITSNIKSGVSIFGVWGKAEVVDTTTTAGAAAGDGDILTGRKAFANGALVEGAMPNNGAVTITPTTTSQTIPAGYHNGSGSVVGDADLIAANIKNNVNIFGVDGKPEVIDTTTATGAESGEILEGREAFVNGAKVNGSIPNNGATNITPGTANRSIPAGYHDGLGSAAGDSDLIAGNIKKGVGIFTVTGSYDGVSCNGDLSPLGRWCDNLDGTVTEMNSGLVWLKDAGCIGYKKWIDDATWDDANTAATVLYDGSTAFGGGDCGLSDGSVAGEWRLPSLYELMELVRGTEYVLDIRPNKFSNVQSVNYWSGTTSATSTAAACYMGMYSGVAGYQDKKTNAFYVWPVRGGQ